MKFFGMSLTTIFVMLVVFWLGTRYPNAFAFAKRG